MNEVIKSLFARHTSSEAQKLATYLDEYFDGQLTLVNSGRSALELALRQIRQRTDRPKAVVLTPSLICRAVSAGAYVPAKSHENFLEVENNPEWLGVARLTKQWRS